MKITAQATISELGDDFFSRALGVGDGDVLPFLSFRTRDRRFRKLPSVAPTVKLIRRLSQTLSQKLADSSKCYLHLGISDTQHKSKKRRRKNVPLALSLVIHEKYERASLRFDSTTAIVLSCARNVDTC